MVFLIVSANQSRDTGSSGVQDHSRLDTGAGTWPEWMLRQQNDSRRYSDHTLNFEVEVWVKSVPLAR